MEVTKPLTPTFAVFAAQEKDIQMFNQRRIKSYFLYEFDYQTIYISLKSFTVLQLVYERLKDDWLTIGSITLEVIYQIFDNYVR